MQLFLSSFYRDSLRKAEVVEFCLDAKLHLSICSVELVFPCTLLLLYTKFEHALGATVVVVFVDSVQILQAITLDAIEAILFTA